MRRAPLSREEIARLAELRHTMAQQARKAEVKRRRRERREWWRARVEKVTNLVVVWLAVLALAVLWSHTGPIDDGAEVVAADLQDAQAQAATDARMAKAAP